MRMYLSALPVWVFLFNSVIADEEVARKNQPLKLAADLVDGSRVLGLPAVTSVNVRTSFADINLQLKAIQDLSFNKDRESCVINLQNGDTVTGSLNLKSLVLNTLFGQISVPVPALRSFTVLSGETGAGLILYYSFDNDRDGKVRDNSGYGHHGVVSGNVLYEKSFKGNAVCFTAKDSFVMCPDKELNVNGWKQVTVSIWVLFNRFTTYGCVVSRGEVTGERAGGIWLFAGGTSGGAWYPSLFRILNEDGGIDLKGTGFEKGGDGYPVLGKWYHMAGTYDGKNVSLYVNGELNASLEAPKQGAGIKDIPATKLVIGTDGMQSRITAWTDVYFDGRVDEVRIYNRALAKEEIRALYKADSAMADKTYDNSSPAPKIP